jgi:hypothetical protein
MSLPGMPRFRIVLEHYAGWRVLEWLLELDETQGLRVAAPAFNQPSEAHSIQRSRVA